MNFRIPHSRISRIKPVWHDRAYAGPVTWKPVSKNASNATHSILQGTTKIPASGLTDIKLNGEIITPADAKVKMSPLLKSRYLFNALFDKNNISFGFLQAGVSGAGHKHIQEPATSSKVVYGTIGSDDILMVYFNESLNAPTQEEARFLVNSYIRLARFLVEMGFKGSVPLNPMTSVIFIDTHDLSAPSNPNSNANTLEQLATIDLV